jgi:hypothetical protein
MIFYIKNISKISVNLYDLGIVLQPEQVFNATDENKYLKKCYSLEMLNNSIKSGAIRKNINLQRIIFTKNTDSPINIDVLLSTVCIPSRCKVTASNKGNNNDELLRDEDADKVLDDWLPPNSKKEDEDGSTTKQ